MAIHVIRMPDIGEGIAEVEVVEWNVKVGDAVHEDQMLALVMTDKATVEIPSPVAGKVLALNAEVGQVMAVGAELIHLEVARTSDEEAPSEPAGAQSGAAVVAGPPATHAAPAATSTAAPPAHAPTLVGAPAAAAGAPAAQTVSPTPGGPTPASALAETSESTAITPATDEPRPAEPVATPHGTGHGMPPTRDRPIASPAVRRRAWELGIELAQVAGSGTGGRIMQSDLDGCVAHDAGVSAKPVGPRYAERHDEDAVPLIGLRRKVAQKMQESKRHIPHFTYVEEIDVTELEALRARLNAKWGGERRRLTLLPFLIRAIVLALREFPQINARFDDAAGIVTRHGAVQIGVATQTEAGLMVPVLRHAEARDLWSTASEIVRLVQAARTGKATREELSGSTITITSLGALGGIVSTPVINHPEVAIVGTNRIVERPVIRAGVIVVRQMMNLSSSFDHRVIDGMHAAEFVQALRGSLECPATLFIE